ncbi:MAG: hypothetical protein JW809_14940 [Pirellulales bacterium]|nr:hypothetical protein [Pirellulales bacterium]
MRIRLRCARAGDGWSQKPGETIDVPTGEARRMVAAGQAVALEEFPPEPDPPEGAAAADGGADAPARRKRKTKRPDDPAATD